MSIFATKSIEQLKAEAAETGGHSLKRVLGPINLVTLGIGAIIGTGIFVLTGEAAAQYAGPAIVLSMLLAGFASALAGVCYAEFASTVPIAGSAYTYGYATLGEFIAWIIGWDLILEYALGAATVAVGWSGHLTAFMHDFVGISFPKSLAAAPCTLINAPGCSPDAIFNLPAVLVTLAVTVLIVIGVKESANVNSAIVIVKVGVVIIVILGGAAYINTANWHPFIPENTGNFGDYGWSGVLRGAGVIFFAYIGFDAVSVAAQEAKNPQKDMPVGILGSLIVCTILYIIVSGLLTATVHYSRLNIGAPVSLAMRETGVKWGSYVINAGALAGLSTVMLVMLLGQSRVFYSMAPARLLWKWAGAIHPSFRTPWKSTAIVGFAVAIVGSLVPIGSLGQMVSIGTLLAFVIVCAAVWILRIRRPDLQRPFRTPWVPFVPIMGIIVSLGLMASLNGVTWVRLIVWLIIGLVIYFTYSVKHSKVRNGLK